MSRLLFNEKPNTIFVDEEDNIIVKLISYPNIEQTEKMIINVCFGHSNPEIYDSLSQEDRDKAIKEVIEGGTLPKALEMTGKFVFFINNVPLTFTHMIVRHRFFTILQMSTATGDLRNSNYLMPRAFARDKEYYEEIKQWYLEGKRLFCEAVDKHNISIQNARLLIPKNNCNHLYIGCDLKSFAEAYSQRMCSCEEPITSNIVFKKMSDEIIKIFPYFKNYFISSCETGKCLHSKQGKNANIVFKRDELHRKFLPQGYLDNNPDNLLHDFTRDEMNKGEFIKTEKYVCNDKFDEIIIDNKDN